MWRQEDRKRHTRSGVRYPSDLTDGEWALVGPVDEAAKAAGLKRRIGAWASHFSAVAPLLEATDFIATLPDIAMRDSLARHDLAARPAPLALPPMPQALFWSGADAMDEGLIWLRGLMRAALGRALLHGERL